MILETFLKASSSFDNKILEENLEADLSSINKRMAIREDVVASAVTFLQDPNVAGSPIENRIAFLHSKNLTTEEVDTALARAKKESGTPNYSNHNYQPVVSRPPPTLEGYQQYSWQLPPPKRDWRDWFILATVMSGMGLGLYNVAKRYIYPLIAPPTTPQLEQDKKSIDESFEKAFSLIDQLAKDTEELKASEQARTTSLDVSLAEVETILNNLKTSTRQREEESRRITDEVRGLKDLIPKAMEEQKKNSDSQLRELNSELKSLKILLGQRMNSSAPSVSNLIGRTPTPGVASPASQAQNSSADLLSTEGEGKALRDNGPKVEVNSSTQGQSSSTFGSSKAAIPSWQLAANRSTGSAKSNGSAISDVAESS